MLQGIHDKDLEFRRVDQNLLEVKNLKKYFPVTKGIGFFRHTGEVKALDGVSLNIKEGETLGVVGESGCGKTTLGRVILRLQSATSGEVWFRGKNVHSLPTKELLRLRAEMQIIFQDPYSSLNPRMKVGEIIGEALSVHHRLHRWEKKARVIELLESVGLSSEHIGRYPHEFSGGQRQRIGLARALAVEPKLIICDEPVSALDVSIQAQVLNLFQDLKFKFHLTYLFISHDLAVVHHISDNIAVMYLGKIVELANRDNIYKNALHPYTQALLSAIPIADPHSHMQYKSLKGELPSPFSVLTGCRFHNRCEKAMEICQKEEPILNEYEKNHWIACHLY